jgi:hypothetical protein
MFILINLLCVHTHISHTHINCILKILKFSCHVRWFEEGINQYTSVNNWIYLGNYWDRNYDDIEDIF